MKEEIAEVQHEIWSHWMRYFFSQCQSNKDGSVTVPSDKVERWKRQMETNYSNLTDKEKISDLEQADKVLKIIN